MGETSWISEASYLELSVSARWLHRTPPAAEVEAGAREQAPPALPTAAEGAAEASHASLRHSRLTWEEHAWFLRSREAAARLTEEEGERLRRLEGAVAAEQDAFRAQRVADADVVALRLYQPHVAERARLPGAASACTLLTCVLSMQVEAVLASRREHEAAEACSWVPHVELPLQPLAHGAPLQHVRLLHSAGRCQPLRVFPAGTHISQGLFRGGEGGGRRGLKPSPPAVDADPACARLAAAEHARFVLCSGAFECLVGAQVAWQLPVTVQSLEGSVQPVAFLGKPLLPARLSLRAKNEMFYKVRRARAMAAVTAGLSLPLSTACTPRPGCADRRRGAGAGAWRAHPWRRHPCAHSALLRSGAAALPAVAPGHPAAPHALHRPRAAAVARPRRRSRQRGVAREAGVRAAAWLGGAGSGAAGPPGTLTPGPPRS